MKAIVVTPTYNERDNIRELISTIRQETKEHPVDILVVDSASPDGTADVVREIQQKDPGVHLLNQSQKLGLGKAYLDGMRWVLDKSYGALFTMDADFSHHPRYLMSMLRQIDTASLVVGSRYTAGGRLESWPFYRQVLSKFANGYARALTGLPFEDLTSGFHCFRTELLRKILSHPLTTEGYAFLVELKYLAIMEGARYSEIPIIFQDRTKGSSKISQKVIFESMSFVLKLAAERGRVRHMVKMANQA